MWPNTASLRPYCAVLASIVFMLTLAFRGFGQSAIHDSTPPGQAPGAPAGSYPLSGFDNVNLFNGHLNFSFPSLIGWSEMNVAEVPSRVTKVVPRELPFHGS